MKKRILSIAVAMAMCLALLPPGTARAAGEVKEIPATGLTIQVGIDYIMGSGGSPVQKPRTPSGTYRAGTGTVTWNLATRTLTLNNATLPIPTEPALTDMPTSGEGAALMLNTGGVEAMPVTIDLIGTNTITGMDATAEYPDMYTWGIQTYGFGKVTITSSTGDGTLTVTGGASGRTGAGIGCHGDLEIKSGATVTALGGINGQSYGLMIEADGKLIVGGTLYASGGTGNGAYNGFPNSAGIHGYVTAVEVQEGGVLESGLHGNYAYKNEYGLHTYQTNPNITVNGMWKCAGTKSAFELYNTSETLTFSENTGLKGSTDVNGTNLISGSTDDYARYKYVELAPFEAKTEQDPLSITNQPAGTIHYGDTFTLKTSGGSGDGAVVWSATGAATVDANGAVKVTGVGEAAITATKVGDDTYADAAATYTFTSEKATPSVGEVTCTAASIHPGTDPATVTLTHSGTTGGTVKLAGGTKFELGEKDYDWTFTPADTANYTSAAGKIRLTVTQAALSGIAVTTQPTKKTYTFGEAFDPAGMVVTATYADHTTAAVTPTFNSALAVGQTTLALSYTEGGVTKTCTLSGLTVNKKAAVTLTAQDSASYSDVTAQIFNFGGLLPSDCGAVSSVTVGSVATSEILASATGDKDAKTITWTLKPGLGNEEKSEVVTAVVRTANYENITIQLTVRATAKTPVTITGVTVQDGTYDGTTHAGYTGRPTAEGYSGDFTITYSGEGYSSNTAPKNAGTYTVVFAVPADDPTFTGSKALTFTVRKAKIDITANDRIVTVGGSMPTLTASVSGLIAGDRLKTQPVVTCDSDLSEVGTFPITVSGAEAPENGNYESGITYHNGTLTVRAATEPADLTETGLALWTGRNGNDGPTPSASYTAGRGTVEWDLSTLTLTLNNATINATDAQCGTALEIVAPSGSYPEVTIVLNGTNTIRGKDDGYSYGINSQCPLRISGSGTLTATGGNTSVGVSMGIDCFGLTVDGGATVSAFGGSSNIHSYGVSSSDVVTVAGNLKTVAGNGNQSFGILVNRGLVVEESGAMEARARTDSTQSYGIAFNGAANVPVTVRGRLTAIGFAPLGNGSAQYQNNVTVRGSYSEDGTELFGFTTNPTSFEATYLADNPKYILIQPDQASVPNPPSTITTTTTTQNPDGSTSTRMEDPATGTVTETTEYPDGSRTRVETKADGTVTTAETDKDGNKRETVVKPDGSSVMKVEQKDGVTATMTADAGGRVEADVKLTADAVSSAQGSGAPIPLPIPQVKAAKTAQDAPVVTVYTGEKDAVNVEIPVAEPTPGTVAVLVRADGTEEVVKTSLPTEHGVAVALTDGATVKLVDNSRSFADVSEKHWADGTVAFVFARELFIGTSETDFSPDAPMTRAMLVTVLARFDGEDTSGGASWYEKGINWAVSRGISDGSNPKGDITREQLAVMLWRYAGSPSVDSQTLNFTDADQTSNWARDALCWAVESKILNGFGDGRLDPKGNATRAQAAQMLKNFIEK